MINCFSINFGFHQSRWPCQAVILGYLFAITFSFTKQSFLITRLVGLNWSIVDLINWLVWLVGQSLVWLVYAFDIVLVIIFLSGLRQNHSPEQSRMHIRPSPGLLALFAGLSRPSKPLSIRSSPASIMLQSSSVGTPAITPLLL